MTSFDINVKIHISNKEKFEILLEVNADSIEDILSPHSKQIDAFEKNDGMKEINVNLLEAANYLIFLFYATGKKYSCTRTKISKLMSIVAFMYAKNNIKLFDDSIYKYDGCGTIIDKIKKSYDIDIYPIMQYQDDKEGITDPLKTDVDIPSKYLNFNTIDESTKNSIEMVFRRFGSFSAFDLGQCINQIISYPDVTKDDKIDLSILARMEVEHFASIKDDRQLIDFLF